VSPALEVAEARRASARIALGIVVTVMTVLVTFAGGPIGAISFAQQQTTAGATIQFMNPDNDTSSEVTAINDGTDEAYHLVAWVSSVPANPRVEFKYQRSGEQEQLIGTGTQTAIADTFDRKWLKSEMPADGTYTLRVLLFSGSTLVAQDSQTININNTAPPSPPTSGDTDVPSAVEIVYPVNGGNVGFFTSGGATAAQIDVTTSPDADVVTVYYTTSSPGSDPVYQECGGPEDVDDAEDGIPCVLQGSDTPEQVRGIAAVAADENEVGLADPDSADAHRANGYTQDPFSLILTPRTQQVNLSGTSTTFPCSDFIIAKVFDQFGRRVVGANVDVHAAGPSDRLAYDDPGTTNDDSSPHKAPDQNAHTTEPEANCEGTTPTSFNSASLQGDHEVGGGSDIKHIESTGGTAENGEFRFRMASGASGVTQISAWADEDGNDVFCSAEPNDEAAIGWGQAPGSATGLPAEQTSCPRPTTPATGTQSPSASPTSPSPSPSSPSPTSSSPSPTPSESSPSPTPTETLPPPPVRSSTRVTINYDGNSFNGRAGSSMGQCRGGRAIVVKKKRPGRDRAIGSDTTNRRGRYSVQERRARGTYYAVAPKRVFVNRFGQQVTCTRDRSPNERVRRR